MILVSSLLLIVVTAALFVKWRLTYWKRRKVPFIEATSIWGSAGNPLTTKENYGVTYASFYRRMKENGEKHLGCYNLVFPRYVPIDCGVVRNVLEMNFDSFNERGFYYNEKDDPVSAHLFALGGKQWKMLRAKLSPAFTGAKIKTMVDIILKCAKQMDHALDGLASRDESINAKDVASRFTMNVIGSCAFGLECNSFVSEQAEFYTISRSSFDTSSTLKKLLSAFTTVLPNLARVLGVKAVADQVSNFYLSIARDTLKHRKTNGVRRNDAFQALIDSGEAITVEEIAAQCLVFFIAGYETTAGTLSFCLYELARNFDVQHKTRDEVLRVTSKYNEEITHEAIEEMNYLDQVIHETLRMYPPLPAITRVCVKDCKIPSADVVVEKGTKIMVSILGVHHDEEYYPEPEKFNPDRFSEENKKKIKPFTYMPFGGGPRMCLGKRLALMELKIALSTLLKKYSFAVNQKVRHPLQWNCFTLTLTSKDTIWLDIKKNEV